MEKTTAPGKPHLNLERRLGLFPVTNIVIANMIGVGIFTTTGLLMSDIGDPYLLLALWVVAGVIALCGALSYGALGAAMPRAGGEYAFLSTLYHPLLGFLAGWASFVVGFSAPIAASAIGFSEYFLQAFPSLPADPVILKKLLALGAIWLFVGIHMRGIDFGTWVQNILTLLKVALVVGLILVGLSFGSGDFAHFGQGKSFSLSSFTGWKTAGLSLMWIMFAYSGWNASVYIGSEIRNPEKTIPQSLLLGTGVVTLLYILVNIVFIYAIPPEEMKGVIAVGGLAMGNLFGKPMGAAFSLIVSFALFSSLSAFMILGPRVYYSMAKDGVFLKELASVNPLTRVPSRSIALQGALSSVMVLSGTFDQILTVMGFALGIFPLLAVAGTFMLARAPVSAPEGVDVPGQSQGSRAGKRFPGYPWAPMIYLAAGVCILTLSFFQRPTESLLAIASVLAGLPVYLYFKKTSETPPRSQGN